MVRRVFQQLPCLFSRPQSVVRSDQQRGGILDVLSHGEEVLCRHRPVDDAVIAGEGCRHLVADRQFVISHDCFLIAPPRARIAMTEEGRSEPRRRNGTQGLLKKGEFE